ncbi:MAG: DUF1275 domain-containing protein [Planctomycetes bacterium]|nr:DUF1275 domain-containing protein [Planctomycetota bacterium]MCB9906059.1 DUF1275 domain-containing protein [Planctomycetota bacterium]
MNTRRDLYVLLGGCLLAFGASVVNVAFLLRTGTSVSHLTGDVSRLAMDWADASDEALTHSWQVLAAALGFVLGAVLAGFVIHQPNLVLARPYGRTVIFIGCLLVGSEMLRPGHPHLAIGLAACACGVQNALATRYRQIILRTTHITGLLTDLGTSLGMRMRGRAIPRHGILVPAAICVAFFLGALTSGFTLARTSVPLLTVVGAGYVLGGLVWSVVKRTIIPPEDLTG